MIRLTPAGCLLTGLLVGCASTTETTKSSAPKPPVDATADAGLDDAQSRRARWAGVDGGLAGEPVAVTVVVGTARAPAYDAPSTSARMLGTIKQGGEIEVDQLLLWRACDGGACCGMPAGRPGYTPTWARVRIGDRVVFVPWSCLVAPSDYASRPPAELMVGAEKDLLQLATGEGGSKGGAMWAAVFAAAPDREALDARVGATEPRFMPSAEAAGALPTEFGAPTPADRFFFGRELAARILSTIPAAAPDAESSMRLRTIGDAIAAASGLPRPYAGWVWIVLDAPNAVDCFGLPGGFVFATSGLMDLVGSDDELAVLLAREVARVEMDAAMSVIASGLATREQAVLVETRDGADAVGDADRWSDVEEGIAVVEAGASPLAGVFDRSREEIEARLDARGVALASACGFDPWAFTNLLVRMNEGDATMPGVRTSPAATLAVAAVTADLVARHETESKADEETPAEAPSSPTNEETADAETDANSDAKTDAAVTTDPASKEAPRN